MATKKTTAQAEPQVPATPEKDVVFDYSKGHIYPALAGVMDNIEAIEKDKQNKTQDFKYRGIDDVYNALHPLLAQFNIVTAPRAVSLLHRATMPTKSGGSMNYTMLSVAYDFVCTIDGSIHTVGPVFGEGMDSGDKSTAKAMAVCHKYAVLQLFCIPTNDMVDGDADTHDEGLYQPPSLMPLVPGTSVMPLPSPSLMPQQPQAPSLMPVGAGTAAPPPAGEPVPTYMRQPVIPMSPPVAEPWPDNNELVIEDEPSAIGVADMIINMAGMHLSSLQSLQDFWHKNQSVLKLLNQNFPSQYQRVAQVFAGHKANLTAGVPQ